MEEQPRPEPPEDHPEDQPGEIPPAASQPPASDEAHEGSSPGTTGIDKELAGMTDWTERDVPTVPSSKRVRRLDDLNRKNEGNSPRLPGDSPHHPPW